jgi:ribonucleoside-diphosphate reductase alpha chain
LRFVSSAGTPKGERKTMEQTTSHTTLEPASRPAEALTVRRMFTQPGVHPFDAVEWELRTAAVGSFRQEDVEFPKSWSQNATNIVAQKYFRGQLGSPTRERSVKQMVARVAGTIADWGRERGYFASESDGDAFEAELTYILLNQVAAFNSPVWFNVGLTDRPQCSACFINGVEDDMDSILELVRTEGLLFKYGSGTGTNFSKLRASREPLSGGGTASGPVSFMRGFDSFAGVIKSGGRTRRAAKMVILDVDHPDIEDFIRSKADEERKAWALAEAGYAAGFNVPGGAYDSVQFQNANHSVRVPDEFMAAAGSDGEWTTLGRVDGSPMARFKASDLLDRMAEAAWICGDPGLQFDTVINSWHTCPESGRINASNPCSEYMFLDDSACNLASLNLMRFRREDSLRREDAFRREDSLRREDSRAAGSPVAGSREAGVREAAMDLDFDVRAFQHAVDVALLAQEILVDQASYPTEGIRRNSHDFRPLGLGYANLGALLMSRGLPYDSAAGRNFAAAVTALMHGRANAMSARMAAVAGPFPGHAPNRSAMLKVMGRHAAAARALDVSGVPPELLLAAGNAWEEALALGRAHGYRNAQVTVLAPTGTIAFMMDCDTTGIEPDIALVKYKRLVGGGVLRMVNRGVGETLLRLGYSDAEASAMLAWLEENGTLEGAPHLEDRHLPIFDCAFPSEGGTRSISPMGHLRMMAAVQPFLSGAISKTVNLPRDSTPADIRRVYVEAWKLGLKSVAVYRDGSKRSQPLSTAPSPEDGRPPRRRLPDERQAITHKFSIAGHEGYVTVGMFEDGSPGELFIVMAKEGSVISGLLDSFATAVSLALQYGVPLKVFVDKFSHGRYEPSGFTNNPQIRVASSITDYIFRWLALKFPGQGSEPPPLPPSAVASAILPSSRAPGAAGPDAQAPIPPMPPESPRHLEIPMQLDAPPCPDCGSLMTRAGACYRCGNCGGTSGCG